MPIISTFLIFLIFLLAREIKCFGTELTRQTAHLAKPPLRVESFDLSQVKLLESPFKRAMDLNARYLLSLEPDRFLHYYRVNADLPPKAPAYGGWESPTTGAGRCLGHYLSALSLQFRASGDRRFKDRIDYIVSELARCQQTNGFLSAQANLAAPFAALAAGDGQALLKSRVPWYIQHKMFAGLRDAYSLAGNEQAREVLLRMANWAWQMTANLSREQFQAMLKQEYGGMSEVLADVYSLSGDSRYLELARRFQDDSTFRPLMDKADKLAQKHANTMIPKLTGAVRIYELSGELAQRNAAEYFWNEVVDHHTYAIGGNSDHEQFGPPDQLTLGPETAETCNTYNMLKLTRRLFCLDPKLKYGDYYERALYNHILASQEPSQGMFTYFVSLKPGHFKTYSTPFESFWCCVGTGMENHTQYGNSIYFHDTNTLYVLLYTPSELTWSNKSVTVRQETDYPRSGSIDFTVRCPIPTIVDFAFRYPAWAPPGMTLSVNGRRIRSTNRPGEFASISRKWNNADKIHLEIPLGLRTEPLPGASSKKAFFYGSLLLAGDLGTNNLPESFPFARDHRAYCEIPDPQSPTLEQSPGPLETWLKPVEGQPLTFQTLDASHRAQVLLRPFYQVYDHRYTVYWDIAASPGTEAVESNSRK